MGYAVKLQKGGGDTFVCVYDAPYDGGTTFTNLKINKKYLLTLSTGGTSSGLVLQGSTISSVSGGTYTYLTGPSLQKNGSQWIAYSSSIIVPSNSSVTVSKQYGLGGPTNLFEIK